MVPAQQCLQRFDRAGTQAENRLVVQRQLFPLDRLAQFRFEAQLRQCFAMHIHAIQLVAAATLILGVIHRDVGVAQEVRR